MSLLLCCHSNIMYNLYITETRTPIATLWVSADEMFHCHIFHHNTYRSYTTDLPVVPWEVVWGSTYGSLDHSHRRRVAGRRSPRFHRSDRICTRCTAIDRCVQSAPRNRKIAYKKDVLRRSGRKGVGIWSRHKLLLPLTYLSVHSSHKRPSSRVA